MKKKLQMHLNLKPVVHAEVNGIEMGVLEDGTPYLTTRAVAKLVGQAPGPIMTLGSTWDEERHRPRGRKILNILHKSGHDGQALFIKTEHNGVAVRAHPDVVCLALLEYYALDANVSLRAREVARDNLRRLAGGALRKLIYEQVGYQAREPQAPPSMRQYLDRLMLNTYPPGYWSVFRESAELVLNAIQRGLEVSDSIIPDISIGMAWSNHWTESDLSDDFGPRKKYPHVFPDYFPQSRGKQKDAWVYPMSAVAAFRIWLENDYLPMKFPGYLDRKVRDRSLSPAAAKRVLEGYAQQALPPPSDR